MAHKDNEADLIPGIQEYCDRWCDRCRATARCEIFYRDSRNPGSARLDQGVPIQTDDAPLPAPSDAPLHEASHSLAIRLHSFLDQFSAALRVERRRDLESDRLLTLQDAFEVLSWYHFQIAVRTDRALSAAKSGPVEEAQGHAKVAWISLSRCLDALLQIHPMLPSHQPEILPLLEGITEMIESLETRFPGHKAFVRPGLDD